MNKLVRPPLRGLATLVALVLVVASPLCMVEGIGFSSYENNQRLKKGDTVKLPVMRIYNTDNFSIKVEFIVIHDEGIKVDLPNMVAIQPGESFLLNVNFTGIKLGKYVFNIEASPLVGETSLNPVTAGNSVDGVIIVYKYWVFEISSILLLILTVFSLIVKRGVIPWPGGG